MTNISIMSAPGQLNGQGLTDAQFLKLFTGEVLTAFAENNIMKGLHRERTITHGKSASFPTIWKAAAEYHKPGTPILGNNKILHGERIIHIDDLLTSSVFIYDLDEAKNHYEIRGDYSREVGAALAREYDQKTMRVAALAARSSGAVTGEPGGSTFSSADFATDLINKDYGGAGVYAEGSILKVANISIKKSNNVPNAAVSAVDGENNVYNGDFSKTVAVCFTKDAIGTVKLRDLKTQMTSGDFNIVYQGTLIVATYAMGHGVLRPQCAIELTV